MINAPVFLSFFLAISWNVLAAHGSNKAETSDSLHHFIALEFDKPGLFSLQQADFELFDEASIKILKIRGEFDEEVISFLEDRPYRYFFSTDRRYLISTGDSRSDSLYLSELNEDYGLLQNRMSEKVAGYDIAVFPHIRDLETVQLISGFADRLSENRNASIPVFITIPLSEAETDLPGNIDFVNFVVPPLDSFSFLRNQLYSLELSDDDHQNYTNLQKLLERSREADNSVAVLDGEWVIDQMNDSVGMGIILKNYQLSGAVTIPVPEASKVQLTLNLPALILLLLFISYILHYKYQPVYRHSLGRFLFNHNFFVDDVIEHRIYLTTPGLILLAQHILLSGLIFLVTARSLISEAGLESLFYHYPLLSSLPQDYYSFFIIGVVVSAFSKALSILWLHLFNRELRYISQVLTLYTWPLQINLLVVTFAVIGLNSGISDFWMISLFVIFLIIWFMSFNVAAIDGAKALEGKSIIYLLVTVGINTLVCTVMAVAIFMIPEVIKPLQLAMYLP